jgi:hypothetical protein
MQRLHFQPTHSAPEIYLSQDEKLFFIRGVSSPEDVRLIYYPVLEWIRNYSSMLTGEGIVRFTEKAPMKFTIDLDYYNSSSAKFLYDIFIELRKISAKGIPVVIEWTYDADDPDMKEAGEDMSTLLGMKFALVQRQS